MYVLRPLGSEMFKLNFKVMWRQINICPQSDLFAALLYQDFPRFSGLSSICLKFTSKFEPSNIEEAEVWSG